MQKKKNKEEKGIKKSYFYDVFSVDWALKKNKKNEKGFLKNPENKEKNKKDSIL